MTTESLRCTDRQLLIYCREGSDLCGVVLLARLGWRERTTHQTKAALSILRADYKAAVRRLKLTDLFKRKPR